MPKTPMKSKRSEHRNRRRRSIIKIYKLFSSSTLSETVIAQNQTKKQNPWNETFSKSSSIWNDVKNEEKFSALNANREKSLKTLKPFHT